MGKLLDIVKHYILEQIEAHQIQEDKTFESNVYYMNGNDGTDFDWDCNARTCEFFLFYKSEKQLGYMKVYATKRGTLEGWVWDTERYSDGTQLKPLEIGVEKARSLKREMMKLDNQDIYDQIIFTI